MTATRQTPQRCGNSSTRRSGVTHGVRQTEAISPDNWLIDQYLLDRPGSKDIQLRLFYDYGSNLSHYAEWQAYPAPPPPTLIVLNDQIFPAEGAHPYKGI